MFTVLCLYGIRPEVESVKTQILGSASLPSLAEVFPQLLRASSLTTDRSTSLPGDHSALVTTQTDSHPSHGGNSGGRRGGHGGGGRPQPQCSYCNRLGHTRETCYRLHGRPPHVARIANTIVDSSEG